jgi:hypothetical protein
MQYSDEEKTRQLVVRTGWPWISTVHLGEHWSSLYPQQRQKPPANHSDVFCLHSTRKRALAITSRSLRWKIVLYSLTERYTFSVLFLYFILPVFLPFSEARGLSTSHLTVFHLWQQCSCWGSHSSDYEEYGLLSCNACNSEFLFTNRVRELYLKKNVPGTNGRWQWCVCVQLSTEYV